MMKTMISSVIRKLMMMLVMTDDVGEVMNDVDDDSHAKLIVHSFLMNPQPHILVIDEFILMIPTDFVNFCHFWIFFAHFSEHFTFHRGIS